MGKKVLIHLPETLSCDVEEDFFVRPDCDWLPFPFPLLIGFPSLSVDVDAFNVEVEAELAAPNRSSIDMSQFALNCSITSSIWSVYDFD